MANFPVKWFQQTFDGAPALTAINSSSNAYGDIQMGSANDYLNCVPGELISIFKGCLVDGFGDRTITSASYDGPSDLVTLDLGSSHTFEVGQIIEVSGFDQAEYNGEFRVVSESDTLIRYTPDTAPSATPASGTGNVRTPAADGWELIEEDVVNNNICFGRTASDATPYKLVIKNGKNWARANSKGSSTQHNNSSYGLWEMVDNFVSLNEYEVVDSGYIPQAHVYTGWYGNEEERKSRLKWGIYADGYSLWFITGHVYQAHRAMLFFGDIISAKPGDRGHCLISGSKVNQWQSPSYHPVNYPFHVGTVDFSSSENGGMSLATGYGGQPGVADCVIAYPFTQMGEEWNSAVTFPNPANNGLYISQERPIVYERELGNTSTILRNLTIRGFLPGVMPTPQECYFDDMVLLGLPGLESVPIRAEEITASNYSSNRTIFFNIDQWRDQAI